jgi:hypothetical protein
MTFDGVTVVPDGQDLLERGPVKPAALFARMQAADGDRREVAFLCSTCRERHGGWCIDELRSDGPPECPLAGAWGRAL